MAVPVLQWQTPARERYHLPAMGQVEVVEWCPTERVLWVAGFSNTRAPAPSLLPFPTSKIGTMPQHLLSHL